MPDPITWYALGKEVADPTLIEEEIDTKILLHNQDASAHGQSSESLYNHRISELLDHISYSIYNIKMNPAARIYKAIVGYGFEADFTTLQAAIDWSNLYNGGTVFVKKGTYTITDDIVLYNNIEIEGEDNDTVIFDFNSGAYQFKLIGTSGTHKKNCWLRNIQIKNSRKGTDGAVYFSYVDDSGIVNCKISNNKKSVGSYGPAVNLSNCKRISVEDNYFTDNQISVNASGCTHTKIYRNEFDGDDNSSIWLASGVSNFIFNNLIRNAAENGITVDSSDKSQIIGNYIDTYTVQAISTGENNPTHYLIISNNEILNGAVNSGAIDLTFGSYRCVVSNNVLYNNDGYGIWLNPADYCTVIGNTVSYGGTGIRIETDSDKNVIVGNVCLNNSFNLVDGGTATELGHNITA